MSSTYLYNVRKLLYIQEVDREIHIALSLLALPWGPTHPYTCDVIVQCVDGRVSPSREGRGPAHQNQFNGACDSLHPDMRARQVPHPPARCIRPRLPSRHVHQRQHAGGRA
jgi:hypothetical protein